MLTIELSVDQLELGRLYFRVCDFDAAIKTLAASLLDAERKENWDRFAQHIPLLLRILAERLDFEEIHNLRHRLKEAPLAVWTSPLHYALGIADLYSNEVESAKGHFESARQTARNVNELAHARFGLIAVSFKQGRFSEASEILFRLRRDLAPTTLQDLKIATHLMSSHILMNQAEIEEAMVQLSLAENLCRNEHNLFMLLNTLFAQAVAQKKLKRFSRALNYLELVDSLTSRRDLKHLSIQVERELKDVRDILARPTLILIEGDGLSLEHPEKGSNPA